MNPLVQSIGKHVQWHDDQGEPLVLPITRMTKREQQVYNVMSALRTLCKALRISPFGRMEDMLAGAHTATDDAGLQIFVEQAYWFPKTSLPYRT